MTATGAILAALIIAAAALPGRAPAKCELGQVAALPVRVTPSRILLDGAINGQPVEFILDTGAQSSMIFAGAAHRLGLALDDVDGSSRMFGAGGSFAAQRVRVRELSLGDVHLTKLSFWAGGRDDDEPRAAMLIGQDILSNWDVEYDLRHGAVRLLHAKGCHGDEVVYWTNTFARAAMQPVSSSGAVVSLKVGLNHAVVDATLDTGSPETAITPEAAMRAGVLRRTVKVAGAMVGGLGGGGSEVSLADLDTVSIGGELVQHAKLQVTDMFVNDVSESTGHLTGERMDMPDMLLGLDFVRAHRLLVAPDQNMVYFTYAGGSVFAPPPSAPQQQQQPGKP